MNDRLKNKIFILDNLLSSEECGNLIKFYQNKKQFFTWNNIFPMNIDLSNDFLKPIVLRIECAVNSLIKEKIEIDWCQIVRWPCSSNQFLHFDSAEERTVFTSITYLNEDYRGGRTYIKNDMEFIPKIGRTVFFDGKFYLHGVTEILDKERYTLPIWYKMKVDLDSN